MHVRVSCQLCRTVANKVSRTGLAPREGGAVLNGSNHTRGRRGDIKDDVRAERTVCLFSIDDHDVRSSAIEIVNNVNGNEEGSAATGVETASPDRLQALACERAL